MTERIETTRDLLNANAQAYPDIPFLNYYDEIVTYRDLDDNTDAFANYLSEQGVGRGDGVSFMMVNSPEFFYTHLGAQKVGAMAVPISCWWQGEEVAFLVNDCRPKVLVMDAEYAPIASEIKNRIPSVERILINGPEEMEFDFPHEGLHKVIERFSGKPLDAEEPAPEDVAEVMYTSGTTGRPKGVMITHGNIIAACYAKTEIISVQPGERALCVLPLFHSGGLNDLAFPCIYRGATIVLRQRFSASEFWECVERYKVNCFYIVPTMWNILLRAPEAATVNTESFKFGISGSAPIPPEQLKECETRFGVPILEAYGATENTGGITTNQVGDSKWGSIGKPFKGFEVKVFDDEGNSVPPGERGEIVDSGGAVMKGYYNSPEATAETIKKGWLHTGDIGYVDEDGFFFIVDRKKEMIIRGGVNVYPKELEHVISTHPKINTVAVIPEPHDKYGQVAKACIVLKRGETGTEEEIRAFCEEKMAPYKVPEHILFRETLPISAVGKVAKRTLIQQLEEEKTAEPVPVAHFFEGMPGRLIPEKAEGVEATVSYNITGKGGGKWTIEVRDGKMALREGILKNPRVYIVARDSDYHDIVTGKLDGITAVITGKMQVEGDVGFMAELREMMEPL